METGEITRQAKQSLTIFKKKQLHECQCRENRLKEYYEKKWLTKKEFLKKIRKQRKKRAEFAEKYLTKYNEFKNLGEKMSLEQENYARDADIIVSSWFIITHQSLPKLFILAGMVSVIMKKITKDFWLLSEKKKRGKFNPSPFIFFYLKLTTGNLAAS